MKVEAAVVGHTVVDARSNEITALPKLLEIIEVPGALVTIDAMGCQTAIAAKIIAEKAGYCLAVKDNRSYFICPVPSNLPEADRWKQLKAIGLSINKTVRNGKRVSSRSC